MKKYIKCDENITLADAVPYENKSGLKIFKTWNKTNGYTSTSLIVDTIGKRFQLVDGQVLRSSDLATAKQIPSVKKVREIAKQYSDEGYQEYKGYGSVKMSSSCNKKYVKADADYTDDDIDTTAEAVLESICSQRYGGDSLYELCYYVAGEYYQELYDELGKEWSGEYPWMYGKAENYKWYIAFPKTYYEDTSEYVEICFSVPKGTFDVLPIDWYDFVSESNIKSNFDFIDDIEPNYSRYEDTIYMFDENGFDIDETEVEPVEFINTETDEILTFDTWDDAEDYAYKNF